MTRAQRILPKLQRLAEDPTVTAEERHAARLKLAELLRKHPELESSKKAEPKPEQLPLPFPAYLEELLGKGADLLDRGERLQDQLDHWLEDRGIF